MTLLLFFSICLFLNVVIVVPLGITYFDWPWPGTLAWQQKQEIMRKQHAIRMARLDALLDAEREQADDRIDQLRRKQLTAGDA